MLNGEQETVKYVFDVYKAQAKFKEVKEKVVKKKKDHTIVLDDGTVVKVDPNKLRRNTFFNNLSVPKKKNFKADLFKECREC